MNWFCKTTVIFLFASCNTSQLLSDEENKSPVIVKEPKKDMGGGEKDKGVIDVSNSSFGNPSDLDFNLLPGGKNIFSVRVRSNALMFTKGTGSYFGSSKQRAYEKLKNDTQTKSDYKVQWTLMDLDSGHVVAESLSSQKRIFGASSSKIFVAAALLDWQKGKLSSSQLQLMSDMITVSSNTAWTNLQKQLGDGSANKGRERNFKFTQRMGYSKTHGFQGWWGSKHGNELTAHETADFLYDTYQGNYQGAEYLWKIMHSTRTGTTRALKYMPRSIFVGGKTGSYSGPTYDTDISKSVRVSVNNHVIVFHANKRQYALVVLANTGSNETAALLAGGLYREYIQ